MIQVRCTMTDCLYHREDPKGAPWCQCAHVEKQYYLDGVRCPLYRLDWSKQAERVMELQEKMRHVQ